MKHSIQFMALILVFFLAGSELSAQEKTAAGVYNEGLTLLKEKNYEEGLKLMEEALALATEAENEQVMALAKKNGSVAASNLGNSSYRAEDLDAAMTYYAKGLELNPENSSNAIGTARVLEKKGESVEAIKAYIVAGDLYAAGEKNDRAEKAYRQGQNIVGKLYVGKEYDSAIETGEAYLEDRENAEVRYYLSRSMIEKDQNESALEHITKAIEMASANGEVDDKYHMAHGQSLENLGNKSEAIVSYQKVTGDKYKAQAEYKIGKLKA